MISDYKWYHRIPLPDGTETPGDLAYVDNWKFISDRMANYNLKGMIVGDIGCRDGLFSFQAEEMGAAEVVGVDNDINPGSELVATMRGSGVEFVQMNLYAMGMNAKLKECFDAVLFFGVLYHLRYPIWGLRCVLNVLKMGGLMLMETALYTVPSEAELIYVPVKNSPYEATSCAFFNEAALRVTLASMGCVVSNVERQPHGSNETTARFFITVHKTRQMEGDLERYWEGEHNFHSKHDNPLTAKVTA